MIDLNVPYAQLEMIKVLQSNFDYEVKGTIYFDDNNEFISFAVRTDSSEVSSYSESSWRICFHTHPDNTARKYGVRYFSPPSVDDIMEIYEHSMSYVPSNIANSLGEISIIFTNEGIYMMQVDRKRFAKFNKDNMPIELLEEILNETFTEFATHNIRNGMEKITNKVIDIENPQISLKDYQDILRSFVDTTTEDYGFNISYHTWENLKNEGLSIKAYNYYM